MEIFFTFYVMQCRTMSAQQLNRNTTFILLKTDTFFGTSFTASSCDQSLDMSVLTPKTNKNGVIIL
jgi:hypothetical protein